MPCPSARRESIVLLLLVLGLGDLAAGVGTLLLGLGHDVTFALAAVLAGAVIAGALAAALALAAVAALALDLRLVLGVAGVGDEGHRGREQSGHRGGHQLAFDIHIR